MKKTFILILIQCAFFITTPCFSKAPAYTLSNAEMSLALNLCGASYTVKRNSIFILIDKDVVINQLDNQIKLGWYGAKKDFLLNHPVVIAIRAAIQSTAFIIPRVYQDNPNLNYLHVYVRYKHDNSLGNSVVNSLCSFEMYRKLSDNINWARFPAKNALKVYPNFKLSAYFNRQYPQQQNSNMQDYYLAEKARRLYLQNLVRSEEQFARIQQENNY